MRKQCHHIEQRLKFSLLFRSLLTLKSLLKSKWIEHQTTTLKWFNFMMLFFLLSLQCLSRMRARFFTFITFTNLSDINRSARCARLKFISSAFALKFRFWTSPFNYSLRCRGRWQKIHRRCRVGVDGEKREECKRQRWDYNKLYWETRTTWSRKK